MKTVLLAVCLSMIAAEAHAISRYDPTKMSCARVQQNIRREGAVVLRYQSKRTPGLPLYNRYVSDDRFCSSGQEANRAYVPTNDRSSCPVFDCKMKLDDDFRFWRRRH